MGSDENTRDDPRASQQTPPPVLPQPVERNKQGRGGDGKGNGKKIEKTYLKPEHWTKYVEAICGVALVFITYYYTQAAFRQAVASEKAANAAKSAADTAQTSLEMANRPWITLQNISIGKDVGGNGPQNLQVYKDGGVMIWHYQFEIVNFGHSPAKVTINDQIVRGVGTTMTLKDFECTPSNNPAESDIVFPGTPLRKDRWASSIVPLANPESGFGMRHLDICITYSEIGTQSSTSYHTRLQFRGVADNWEAIPVEGTPYYPIERLELRQTIAE